VTDRPYSRYRADTDVNQSINTTAEHIYIPSSCSLLTSRHVYLTRFYIILHKVHSSEDQILRCKIYTKAMEVAKLTSYGNNKSCIGLDFGSEQRSEQRSAAPMSLSDVIQCAPCVTQ